MLTSRNQLKPFAHARKSLKSLCLIFFAAMFLAIFTIFLGVNGLRNQDFPVTEMKIKMEKFETKIMEEIETLKTRVQDLERNSGTLDLETNSGVEKTAAKLAEDYNKMSSEDKESFLQSFQENCDATETPEAGCWDRVEYLAKAFKNPCQGDGCENGENVIAKGDSCEEQKLKFVQWTQVMCSSQPPTQSEHRGLPVCTPGQKQFGPLAKVFRQIYAILC